jgi:HEPN domain-containing protein
MVENFDIDKTFNHWLNTAERDSATMIHLYNSKDYHWALFIGHIVIERLLKAGIVKHTSNHAPFTHDLAKLAEKSGLKFSEDQLDWLDAITAFNMNARYDSYKEAFYKKCTAEFTTGWIEKILVLQKWIKERL